MPILKRRDSGPASNGLSLGAALLLATVHAFANGIGDFAPLAVGNTWVYGIREVGGGFSWNPSVAQTISRTLRVESRSEAPGGGFSYVLAFRDSLYNRQRTPDKGSTSSSRPDTLRTGRFQVAEAAGDGRLTLHPLGDPIPSGMEVFFRRRYDTVEFPAGTGDSLSLITIRDRHNAAMSETAAYAQNAGLYAYYRAYDLLGEAHIPGYMASDCRLVSFNGRAIDAAGFLTAASRGSRVENFSGLRLGRSWRYRGLRQQVPIDHDTDLRRDSVDRMLVVIRATDSKGFHSYGLSLRDSVYRRAWNGQPRADTVELGTITVDQAPADSFPTVVVGGLESTESRDDVVMIFKWQSFLEDALEMRDFGSGPVRTSEYREIYPGLLEDTLVHAEGIGLVRRSRVLLGTVPGHYERIDMRLVGLDGKPFEAVPVSIYRGFAGRTRNTRTPSSGWMKMWDLRDLLGRIRNP